MHQIALFFKIFYSVFALKTSCNCTTFPKIILPPPRNKILDKTMKENKFIVL